MEFPFRLRDLLNSKGQTVFSQIQNQLLKEGNSPMTNSFKMPSVKRAAEVVTKIFDAQATGKRARRCCVGVHSGQFRY